MFVLSSNSRTVSFIAGTNGGSQVPSACYHDAGTSNIKTLEVGKLVDDTARSLEEIIDEQNIELAAYKASIEKRDNTIADLQLRFSGWKMTAEALQAKLIAAEEEISRLHEALEELSALARAVILN